MNLTILFYLIAGVFRVVPFQFRLVLAVSWTIQYIHERKHISLKFVLSRYVRDIILWANNSISTDFFLLLDKMYFKGSLLSESEIPLTRHDTVH